jgi:uncharacterized protein YqeY
MSIQLQLSNDMKECMKKSDKVKLAIIRMLNASIQNEELEIRKKEKVKNSEGELVPVIRKLTDEEILELINRHKKQSQEVIEIILTSKQSEEDKVKNEKRILDLQNEIAILTEYLPKQLSEEEVTTIISSLIAENAFSGVKDKGDLMKVLMPKVKGIADGKMVNELVGKILV